MPHSTRSSSTSAPCRLEWRPSRMADRRAAACWRCWRVRGAGVGHAAASRPGRWRWPRWRMAPGWRGARRAGRVGDRGLGRAMARVDRRWQRGRRPASCAGAGRWRSCAGAMPTAASRRLAVLAGHLAAAPRRELRLAAPARRDCACTGIDGTIAPARAEAHRMFKPIPVAIGLRYLRAKRRNGFISFISLASILGIAHRRGRADHHARGDERLPARDPRPHAADGRARHRQRRRRRDAELAAGGRRGATQDPRVAGAAPYIETRSAAAAARAASRAIVRGVVPGARKARSRCSAQKMVQGKLVRPRAGQLQHRARHANWRCGSASASATR